MNDTAIFEIQLAEEIKTYVEKSASMQYRENDGFLQLVQKEDQKVLSLFKASIAEVLHRTDGDGNDFLQVNLKTGDKLLITQQLIGFKPYPVAKLDLNKIPKVVTTPDCLSVFEAIEECLRDERIDFEELDTLKRVFSGVIQGAESIGFQMEEEKTWLNRLVVTREPAV